MIRRAWPKKRVKQEIDKHMAVIEFLKEQLRGEEFSVSCLKLDKKQRKGG
jgi:hypothetical protein